jgi:hypothetical protein
MAFETHELERGVLSSDTYDNARSRLFGLIGLSGVEINESCYAQDFSLTRTIPGEYGPYKVFLERIRVCYDENQVNGYESLLVQITHKGIRGEVATLFCGTKLGITVIGGVVKYAWINTFIPILKESIPEALPQGSVPLAEVPDFTEWEHEYDVRHKLDERALQLVLVEVNTSSEL